MERPKNKEEYRAEMAEAFTKVLEEKGLFWRKEWTGKGGGAPHNGVTKALYRGCNAFWLSLIAMAKGYTDPRWVTMHQIMDENKKYHPNEKWHLKKGSKATYVEYWFPYDVKNKKAMTWDEYHKDIADGRSEKEFTLSTNQIKQTTERIFRHRPVCLRRTGCRNVLLFYGFRAEDGSYTGAYRQS